MKKFFIIFLAVMLYIPINGFAQNKDYLDSIVVTATRSEIPLDDTIVPVIVINRDQIKQSQAKDLSELLRFLYFSECLPCLRHKATDSELLIDL